MNRIVIPIVGLFLCSLLHAQHQVDVLIVGGGAGGTAAGIQAARMGVKVQVLEKTNWLGGMLTSAGVSAIDGNHKMPSGIWGEFRQHIYDYYGGPKAVATGWVSHTLFEPSVGNSILQKMADIPNLEVIFKADYQTVQKAATGWLVTYRHKGKVHTIKSRILIDATELGELLPLVGADYRLGMDSKQETGEEQAPESANSIVQDLTYVLILEDVGTSSRSRKGLVRKPKNYDAIAYECACNREGGEMFSAVSYCKQMLDYGKLPNGKYMINWPNCGNDFYLNWPQLTKKGRLEKLKEAKRFSQGFVYYIQNTLGFKQLRVSQEFPTQDGFPMMPYHREARRMKGKIFLTTNHLESPYDYDLYKTGIAVGDYPIDHHHAKKPDAPEIDFINIKVPSYSIPMGSLIPEKVENFLVAEKNISVSNIVNGTTRLQPVVLGVGQAAGTVAATAILNNWKVSETSIRKVQQTLLFHKAYLIPLIDVLPIDPDFTQIQRIASTGIFKTEGIPYKWANETWFYPERMVSEYELKQGLLSYYPEIARMPASGKPVGSTFLIQLIG
ncbi:MAG: FAD-dependent oxidoreductase, partial [Bacteroidota bacterium]